MAQRILCIPNISEGRRPEFPGLLRAAIWQSSAHLLDLSSDPDHNRSVIAFEGTPIQVRRAILNLTELAVHEIDLRTHRGAHPRIGAIDVVPLVPLSGVSEASALRLSRQIGRDVAREFGLPAYLYEKSAKPGRISDLPTLRKGGYEAWADQELCGLRKPDFGPARLHPSAGAMVLGVRDWLIAFNVILATANMRLANAIAKEIRELRATDPTLVGVRAIAVYLSSRDCAQVSLNLTEPDNVNLFDVRRAVELAAARHNVRVAESELIGVIREHDLAKALNAAIQAGIRSEQVVRL